MVCGLTARTSKSACLATTQLSAVAGQPVTITLNGPVGKPGEFSLPHVDGLTVNGSGADPNTKPPSYNFFVTPAHAGDFTIPAFDIHSDDGRTFHVQALKLHATSG